MLFKKKEKEQYEYELYLDSEKNPVITNKIFFFNNGIFYNEKELSVFIPFHQIKKIIRKKILITNTNSRSILNDIKNQEFWI